MGKSLRSKRERALRAEKRAKLDSWNNKRTAELSAKLKQIADQPSLLDDAMRIEAKRRDNEPQIKVSVMDEGEEEGDEEDVDAEEDAELGTTTTSTTELNDDDRDRGLGKKRKGPHKPRKRLRPVGIGKTHIRTPAVRAGRSRT
eukprot:TRINITY_DN789_c0_g1_i2.p2 TRINITY_DN789_c0_g1~~TRINITY_DN789_c0_g1_i2.p2  ORF type:complete len:144 (-),score=44.55 TRINITY_DN789_c0_g1_i2:53-484(-)